MRRIVCTLVMLCVSLIIGSAGASDTLEIFGNANMDGTIDEKDVAYVEGVIKGANAATNLSDANYDGIINDLDIAQIEMIIGGKEKKLTLIDSSGSVVTVNEPIKRIVTLNSHAVETMRSLKVEMDKIVGVDKYTKEDKDFYPELNESAANLGSIVTPDIEKILELQPDLVIQYSTLTFNESVEKIKKADPNTAVVRFDCWRAPIYIDEVKKLGYILGKKEDADEFVEFYSGWLDAVEEKVKDNPEDERPKVYIEAYSPYQSSGNKYGWHEIVEMAGGHNIFGDISADRITVDPEEVVEDNPEIIIKQVSSTSEAGYSIEDPSRMSEIREEIMNRPELANVTAVEDGKVFIISSDICSSASLVVGNAYMAKWFYPDLFEDLDPKAIHQEYLERFQDIPYRGVYAYSPQEGAE